MKLAADAFRGSYPPLVTPFTEGAVDHAAYARLVEHVIAGGSHGVVVNGTTAEPTTLTVAERKALLETAVRAVRGRVPVVAATGTQSFAETVELTAHAEQAGAQAVLVVTPYFSRPPVDGIVDYYAAVAARTALPLFVYHIPGRAAVSLPADAFAAIVERAPSLVGVKHASTDIGFVSELLGRMKESGQPEFRVFVGLEELSFPMMAVGASGLMNAAANLLPREIADLAAAALRGETSRARALHDALFELNRSIFWDTNPIPLKYLLASGGILPGNEHRLPMRPAPAELRLRLDSLRARLPFLRRGSS